MSTQTHLDQLDILSTYMSYWIEFKDKERVKESLIPKNAIRSDFMCEVRNSGLDIVVEDDKGAFATYAHEKKQPLEFEYVTGTFSKIIPKIGQEKAKQSVIQSIQKFV